MSETAEAGAPQTPRTVSLPLVLRPLDDRSSGAGIARLFHKGLALLFGVAWLSLSGQILGLIGSRGLLPLGDTLAAIRADHPISFFDFPSLFLWFQGDLWLRLGPWVGVVFAAAAWVGLWPRLFLGASTLLYLSYATACRTFLAFQWDNLLLEAGFLSVLLPVHEARRGAHVLFRLLLFKLYFESGLGKWQSPAGDWRDGSAMTFYYETAPLPTPLAFYAHHLPLAWHHLESWATLALELVVSLFIFGPRIARLIAFALFTFFQSVDFATANYGFFCPLAAWLGIFLLGERDLARFIVLRERLLPFALRAVPAAVHQRLASASERARLVLRRARHLRPRGLSLPPALVRAILAVVGLSWIFVSGVEAYEMFGAPASPERERWLDALASLTSNAAPFRLANTYHLFASVTRERLEPAFEVEEDGSFQELPLRYKPGPVNRRPSFVAPHQPRVDFQLWFHGLAPRRQPAWMAQLLGALCEDPPSVAWLFATTPPPHPGAVRLSYWTTHFASQRPPAPVRRFDAEQGLWWQRSLAFRSATMPCAPATADPAVEPRK